MEKSRKPYAVLILAAGEARRMGTPKQLLPWRDTTLLGQVIAHAHQVKDADLYVVLGAHAKIIQRQIAPIDFSCIVNSKWHKGLGSSIASGIQYICNEHPRCQGILLLLGDQPFLNGAHLQQMIRMYKKTSKKIIATAYGKQMGVPALFHPLYFRDLGRLSGNEGAKHILEAHATDVLCLDAQDLTMDVDTPAEYKRLKE
ncbi:MAG: nucleotidyltransferase family protein [Bacteroidota bacterium]